MTTTPLPPPTNPLSPPLSPLSTPSPKKPSTNRQLIEIKDESDSDSSPEISETAENGFKVLEAQARHQEDLKKHHYEPPKADKVQNDWQVAYVWAFIIKFNLKEKIRKLECLEDFENCLEESVANRPDDVLEGILVRFIQNLKPGLRNVDCTNVQTHLANYINEMLLNTTEFTVWDRPWAPNEEARGSCCNPSDDRWELGRLRYIGEPLAHRATRNPVKKAQENGGGIFELDWRERALLLRQLVDWQLNHADGIRAIINRPHIALQKNKAAVAHIPEIDTASEPIGMDRNKNRIWTFDASPRLYSSGNPFKRPCPLTAISSTRAELQALIDRYTFHGEQKPPKPKASGTGPKGGKVSQSEMVAYRKLVKGIEDERKLGARLVEELLPDLEKEEQRIARAKKRIQQALEIAQMAESRLTRTRRPTRKIDYSYEDEDDLGGRRSSRRDVDYNESGPSKLPLRPVIPGERASARVRGRVNLDHDEIPDSGTLTPNEGGSINGDRDRHFRGGNGDGDGDGDNILVDNEPPKKRAKGYAWVEEVVPSGQGDVSHRVGDGTITANGHGNDSSQTGAVGIGIVLNGNGHGNGVSTSTMEGVESTPSERDDEASPSEGGSSSKSYADGESMDLDSGED